MREVVIVSRCEKKSARVSGRILDRYFWRIGHRTWRGRASNQCLDRVTSELRATASRATAVAFHEIKGTARSQHPIVIIGSRGKFSDEGRAPVSTSPSSHPSAIPGGKHLDTIRGIISVAIFFHDLGKATKIFQRKIRSAVDPKAPPAPMGDPVRHEVFSAVTCDILFGKTPDKEIVQRIAALTPEEIDLAAGKAAAICYTLYRDCQNYGKDMVPLPLGYLEGEGNAIARAICDLVLVHHRLPGANETFSSYRAGMHVNLVDQSDFTVSEEDFHIHEGQPYWHEDTHLATLKRSINRVSVKHFSEEIISFQARTAMMFADHLGSAAKIATDSATGHVANSIMDKDARDRARYADSLSTHIRRVQDKGRAVGHAVFSCQHVLPALDDKTLPTRIHRPDPNTPTDFAWQLEASEAAARMASDCEGGFFGCLMAGTGSGKTRAAPTILAAAAMNDARSERRYFRMFLGLGLRTLASQSAREYVEDLGFSQDDVSVMIGTPPVKFRTEDVGSETGSESLSPIASWFDTETAEGDIPEDGSAGEHDWIRSLSSNPDRFIPAAIEEIMSATGRDRSKLDRLIRTPVVCATIDHVMSVTSPMRSKHLAPSLRIMTSDVILDEIDQYGAEDLSAIGRLAYHVGLSGRRLIIMSATVTEDVVTALFDAYRSGWQAYAAFREISPKINALVTSDISGGCVTRQGCRTIAPLYQSCAKKICKALEEKPPLRRAEVLPSVDSWEDLVPQIDTRISDLHDALASDVEGFTLSAGFVKLTRIAHVAAMAEQLPSGVVNGRLRKVACLHSNFPRISRAWMEENMQRAFKRKRGTENAGFVAFCLSHGIFDDARAAGVRDIEIVFVTSPVLETGNDVDFDYAILDPTDLRSVVQSAGRVNRHRKIPAKGSNVAILGTPLVAMQDGRIAYPGVETPVDKITGVHSINLEKLELLPSGEAISGRTFSELCGGIEIDSIDARLLIDPACETPFRRADDILRAGFMGGSDSLDAFLTSQVAKLSTRVPLSRSFRRSTGRNIETFLSGVSFRTMKWHIDMAPGTRFSESVEEKNIQHRAARVDGVLFKDLLRKAFEAKFGDLDELSRYNMRRFSSITIRDPFHGRDDLVEMPDMMYSDHLGLIRGDEDVVLQPFGRMRKK
jgi:CRISPR-associated endonuclease/helicase Cas3